MRSDKKKSIAKIAKAVIENPLASEREIADKTGIGKSTVNRIKQEVGQIGAKDDRIVGICEKDFNIVRLGQLEIEKRFQNKKELENMRTFEIAQTIEKSEKRYMLFKGDVTGKDGGLKDKSAIESLNNILGLD